MLYLKNIYLKKLKIQIKNNNINKTIAAAYVNI